MKRNIFELATSDSPSSNTGDDKITHCSTDGGMTDVTTTVITHSRTVTTATPAVVLVPVSLTLSSNVSTFPLVSPIENMDVLRLVVSFVGPKHYLFIALISRSFHVAYVQEFPKDKWTKPHALTVEYTNVRCADLKYLSIHQKYRLSCDAARFGNLPAMKHLLAIGCPLDKGRLCPLAAENGHLNTFQYAHENDCYWNEVICKIAAENGYLDILQYAHENGCPWDEWTCAWAARYGELDTLQYAHENGCPWDEQTCENAAASGDLNVLRYAKENGCPYSRRVRTRAVENDHYHIIRYYERSMP